MQDSTNTNSYRKARTDIDIDFKDSKSVIAQLPCVRSTEKITEDGLIPIIVVFILIIYQLTLSLG